MIVQKEILGKIGKCIYCGETKKRLYKEHIVPYGLSGPWELLEASCKKCATITSKFEQEVLRKSLIVPRVALDLKTRRKKQRPEKLKFTIERNGKKEEIEVSSNEFALMILPITELPAYIDGRNYKEGISIIGSITVQVGGVKYKEFLKKYNTKKLSSTTLYIGTCFDRMLAKIAYGFSVANIGIENIKETYILPAILGQKEDVGYWVGTAKDKKLSTGKDLHLAEVSIIKEEIIVRIKLFALYDVPEYLVVVGKVDKKFSKS